MTAYDNDPRVQVIVADMLYQISSDDLYNVSGKNDGTWHASLSLDSAAMAGVTRGEGSEILQSARRGPFPSVDEAIHSLIGDPQ